MVRPSGRSNAILARGSELSDLRSWERTPVVTTSAIRPIAAPTTPRVTSTLSRRIELPKVAPPMGQSHLIGVQSHLAGWSSSTDFTNTYDFQTGRLDRHSEPRLVFVKDPYIFELIPYRTAGNISPGDLKNALLPLARGGEIKPGQFGGRPSYGVQHKRADHIERFVSWNCQGNSTLYLGRFRGPDSGSDTVKAWTSLARGLACNEK